MMRGRGWLLAILALLLLVWWLALPRPLFDVPISTVLEDRGGQLLSARIAADGQWRFPAIDTVPEKLATCIVRFEDRRFYRHPGIDLRALLRASRQNLRAGRVVSGGSTLTMQVIRLAQGNPPRTLLRKLGELLLALRLDLTYRKAHILALWAAHAPYGGNVVGVEAAAWRYFGKAPAQLSWAEAATLAVLPNSPALIHPGRNRAALLAKRNRLLDDLREQGILSSVDWELAHTEPLPEAPLPLPTWAPHLLDRAAREHGPGRYTTTIDLGLQQHVGHIAERHHRRLQGNYIQNLAVLVVEVATGQTLAYIGNAPNLAPEHSPAVDIVTAPRSPGSLLKPMLYGLALQSGTTLPRALLPDVPSSFRDFRPANFDEAYDGAVPANEVLARSLNVPMVHLLQQYGVERFHYALQQWKFDYINRPASHYGLSLILGGCEVNLWEMTGWFAGLGRTVRNFYPQQGHYNPADWREPHYLPQTDAEQPDLRRHPHLLSAGAAWFVLEAMNELERPDTESGWERFAANRRIAWKTGTSFGFRDAWAIGLSPRYTVGVWAGNADGEGRPGLIGVQAAAPLLFDIFNSLPPDGLPWFEPPYDEWRRATVCRQSGYRALPICPTDTTWLPETALNGPGCPYHELIHLDRSASYRTQVTCAAPPDRVPTPWFVLPALQESYYRRRHPDYRTLPPWRDDCRPAAQEGQAMQLVYPRQPSRIFVPRNLDGSLSAVVFEVAHRDPTLPIYWHLDEQFVGQTQTFHSLELRPPPGKHRLVLVDADGERLEQVFEVWTGERERS